MRLPEKIRAARPGKNGASLVVGVVGVRATGAAGEPPAATLETTDFLKTWALRKTIHDRERGACFYCLRRTPANVQCLDHVRATRTLRTQFLATFLRKNEARSGQFVEDYQAISSPNVTFPLTFPVVCLTC